MITIFGTINLLISLFFFDDFIVTFFHIGNNLSSFD
jgi:hypothetical protein